MALGTTTRSSITSRDGTVIGYRQIGRGPGLLVVHGAMESADSHLELAEALADAFTVTLYDRRGRGRSGPCPKDAGITAEVEDVAALLRATGGHDVFGVSSGALIGLHAACVLPAIRRLALYEPALSINGSVSTAFLSRFDQEIADGRVAAALVTGMKGSQMGPAVFNAIPDWLLERLTGLMMAGEDRRAKPGQVTMRALAPTLHHDFELVLDGENALDSFKAIHADVLLLGGTKSPAYLKVALGAVEHVLPGATRVEFPGLNHGGSGNRNRGGQPQRVAPELCRFFLQDPGPG